MGLYSRYRTLGLVCNDRLGGSCRSVVHRRGSTTFITSPADGARSLQLFDVGSLRLKGGLEVCRRRTEGGEMGDDGGDDAFIAAIEAYGECAFAAVGRDIVVLERMKRKAVWSGHEEDISDLLMIGEHLVSLSSTEKRLILWSSSGEMASDFYFYPDFVPVLVSHPPTYLNKVVVSGEDGRFQLWNFRTRTLVHDFSGFGSPVTVIEPSSVVDVVAFGLADGRIVLHNIRYDETIETFYHADETAVTSLSFRDDGDESLVSGSSSGDVSIWDLKEKRSRLICRQVHPNGVSTTSFVRGEPLLVTTGADDNSIKVHIFDTVSGRVLRSRSGHLAPPTIIRFCGEDGRQMISAGLDREVRIVSTIRASQNREMSQSAHDKKRKRQKKSEDDVVRTPRRLPQVVDLAVGAARRGDEDFANVVTAHTGMRGVYTWQMDSGALAKQVLTPPATSQDKQKEETATAVGIAPAGHSCFVGYSNGTLHSFNLQSGRHLGEFGDRHGGRVTALATNALGETLVSGSDDLLLMFWDAHTYQLRGKSIPLLAGVEHIIWSVEADLVAVGCDDFTVLVFDAETRALARCLKGHTSRLTDLCFAPSGRWILSTSTDSTIRTWDLLAGTEVDIMRCQRPPTSVAFSPEGAFIATTHVGEIGITLWVNKTHFGTGSLSSAPSESLARMDEVMAPISDHHVTLSNVPVSQWSILSNLEAVRQRNKPKKPVEKPEAAPFFLPTVEGLNPVFAIDADDAQADGEEDGMEDMGLLSLGTFAKLCIAGEFEAASKLMKETGPSGADLQLRSVEKTRAREAVLRYFHRAFTSRHDFDLTEAHLEVFLKANGAEIAQSPACTRELAKVREAHRVAWRRLQSDFSILLTLTAHFGGQQ